VVADVREFRSCLPSLLHQHGLQLHPQTLEVSRKLHPQRSRQEVGKGKGKRWGRGGRGLRGEGSALQMCCPSPWPSRSMGG
jgi:hypothetical protein